MIGHIKFLAWGQLYGCSVTRPFLSLQRVWLVRLGMSSEVVYHRLRERKRLAINVVVCFLPIHICAYLGVASLGQVHTLCSLLSVHLYICSGQGVMHLGLNR